MENSNIIIFLKRSMSQNVIVSVFSDREQPDKCSVGYIDTIAEEQVLIKHVTPTGMVDGFMIRRLEDVFRVDIDGQYEQKIQQLYTLQGQCHQMLFTNQVKNDSNLFKEALANSQKLAIVVNICIDETESQDSIIGFVKEISDNEVVVSRISDNGLADGESVILLDDIIKLNCDSDDEHILKLLYQSNKDNSVR